MVGCLLKRVPGGGGWFGYDMQILGFRCFDKSFVIEPKVFTSGSRVLWVHPRTTNESNECRVNTPILLA